MELNTALQKLKEYERRGFALSHEYSASATPSVRQ